MKHKGLTIRLMLALVLVLLLALAGTVGAQEPDDTTTVPAGEPEPVEYVEGDNPAVEGHSPVIRVYKDSNAWFGENRDHATLLSIGKTLGTDYFIHPISACASGIPAGTSVVFFSSNGFGSTGATSRQNLAACQASLAAFLNAGGVVIVDMGDNDYYGGYMVPGATGTPAYVVPSPCGDATLTLAASGHPIVVGPDGIPGTGDDLNNSNIDLGIGCWIAHGNLVNGITLPPSAALLMTATFGGVQKPILAEYCYNGVGRVIVDTLTKEWNGQQPVGTGPTPFMRNLFSYALSPAAKCNQPPTADPNGSYLGAADSPILFDGTGSSDPDSDTLTYDWDWGDSSSSPNAGATPSHSYSDAGIYDVCLTVTDPGGLSDTACTIAIVYDPSAGFVTGGVWIDSPEGAYKPDESLTGKANFGFVSKYKKGADTPTGNTEFQFHAASLNFHSDSYEWLVVTGSDYAKFKGVGTINGEGAYKFMLWAGDGDPDTFRIRIWEEDEGMAVETDVYDNGFDQAIGGGSIVIHTGKK